MISHNQILNTFRAFADAHKQIQRFEGEFAEQLPNLATKDVEYIYMFAAPVATTGLDFVNEVEYDVYFIDRLRKDRENTNDVVSDTLLVSQDFTRWLEEGQEELGVVHAYPATPINNALPDYVDGWVLRIRVEVERVAECELPMDTIPPPPSDTCDPATYTIENSESTELASGSIPSGGSQNVTIGDSEISINGTAFETLPAEVDTDIVVKDSDGAAVGSKVGDEWIVPAAPMAIRFQIVTGITTSTNTGDDGDRQDGFLTSWFVLPFNNAFGNTNRFTDEFGGQDYVSGIMLDHAMTNGVDQILGFDPNDRVATSYTDAITTANAHSVGGFNTGWFLPNIHMMFNLMWFENPAATYTPMNYAPLNLSNTGNYWSSSDRTIVAASQAQIVQNNSANGVGVSSKTTSTNRHIYARIFTYAELGL